MVSKKSRFEIALEEFWSAYFSEDYPGCERIQDSYAGSDDIYALKFRTITGLALGNDPEGDSIRALREHCFGDHDLFIGQKGFDAFRREFLECIFLVLSEGVEPVFPSSLAEDLMCFSSGGSDGGGHRCMLSEILYFLADFSAKVDDADVSDRLVSMYISIMSETCWNVPLVMLAHHLRDLLTVLGDGKTGYQKRVAGYIGWLSELVDGCKSDDDGEALLQFVPEDAVGVLRDFFDGLCDGAEDVTAIGGCMDDLRDAMKEPPGTESEDDAEWDISVDVPEDFDIGAIPVGDIVPGFPRDTALCIASCDPVNGEDAVKVFRALAISDRLDAAYRRFSDMVEGIEGLDGHSSELAEFLADIITDRFIHGSVSYTFGRPDVMARCCPEGGSAFFMAFGRRAMTHLKEAKDAQNATDMPDAYAMFSRFIFDTGYDDRMPELMEDVAEAYGRTANYLLKFKSRLGSKSQVFASLCEHCRRVYEGMANHMRERFEDHPYISSPPVMAGHDFDNLFAHWFAERCMQGQVIPKAYTDSVIGRFCEVLDSIIDGDGE